MTAFRISTSIVIDGLPDLNIDGDGGKADFNIDVDEDGKPDENIIEITEWKPEWKERRNRI